MLVSLALPILLSGIALFLMSFLSWMVLGLHKRDWSRMPMRGRFYWNSRINTSDS